MDILRRYLTLYLHYVLPRYLIILMVEILLFGIGKRNAEMTDMIEPPRLFEMNHRVSKYKYKSKRYKSDRGGVQKSRPCSQKTRK